jgi:glutaredoxin
MIVDYDKDIDKYVKNEIVLTKDNDGKNIKALHQNIIKKQTGSTQVPYIIYTKKNAEELYIKYSVKYPKDIVKKMTKDG